MNFPSIDIQGSILSNDILGKIRSEQASHQQGKDFHNDFTNAKLKDEISFAWQEAKGQWTIFKSKLGRLKDGETGTTETRNFWIAPLLTNLGYNLSFNRQAEELNGKSFPIGYRDTNLDNFPVYIGGYHESLDKRPENKQLRVSPHAMLQEYLNYSEHLYGVVTNGCQLRLLRDASRITRLSYIEFNLEKMMEEDMYSDFVILYRLLHASRMPRKIDRGAESIIEHYHQEGLATGSTIRNKLGEAVKAAIKNLATGFINHPNNTLLRDQMEAGNLDAEEYYRHQLRIIYRLLFLFVIEERNLVYADSKTLETKRFNQVYFNHYSLLRLRKRAKKLLPPDANRHYDLWQSLISTFSLFEKKEIGEKMGIMSLQGDLFGYDAIRNNYYDLHHCYLGNDVLLHIIKSLSYFENDNKVLIAVNYGGLDVEEFGSVYEGLLELKLDIKKIEGSDQYSCSFDSSNERGKSGSHYTPEELVQPLIKHSLDYLVEDIFAAYHTKKANKEQTIAALLKLKVCDVACGSGHILLSAARRIALTLARVKTDEEQPNPLSIRKAMKDVVRNCIYGVDKNPLAVELCKIALWLEAYNPGEPLNFLDHHIKCGDAIVGLAHRAELETGIPNEAFKTLPGDDKSIAKVWSDKNKKDHKLLDKETKNEDSVQLSTDYTDDIALQVKEALAAYNNVINLPERTPEEITAKAKAYRKYYDNKGQQYLEALANAQVGQFFISKTIENKDHLLTHADYLQMLKGYKGWQGRQTAYANVTAQEHRFFHWFLEFPEVFSTGGFDCILGNPPFLGGQKLSGSYGNNFLEYIKFAFQPIGAVDLVTYFFRRIFSLLRPNGFQSLISTNTIAQGSAREGGLDVICSKDGVINHAVRSMRWPGVAAVEVSLITIHKGAWNKDIILDNKKVERITPYLDDSQVMGNPVPLKQNEGKSFIGSYVLGMGFILTQEQAEELISKDVHNKDVLFPYLNGEDLNNDPEQKPSRWVINFFDWSEEKARTYPDCFEILERLVKPERMTKNDKRGREKWWQFLRTRGELYETISKLDQVMAINRHAKYFLVSIVPKNIVYSEATVVLALDSFREYGILSSSIHEAWAWKHSSTMKGDTLRYSASNAFETFPFLGEENHEIHKLGSLIHSCRKKIMIEKNIGLTEVQNLLHDEELNNSILVFNDVLQLRSLQCDLDHAIVKAYGWDDLKLDHGFYEVDYLSEKDRHRFTIHPDTRKVILQRLLLLNKEIFKIENQITKNISTYNNGYKPIVTGLFSMSKSN